MVDVFYATTGSVNINGTEFKTQVTDISIDGLDADFDTVFTFGDSFQDNDRQSPVEVTITSVKQDNALERYVLGGAADATYPITYSGDTTNRTNPTIKLDFFNDVNPATTQLRYTFSGCRGINISQGADAEGYLTEEITFKTLAKNYSTQFTNNITGSPIL